MHYHIVVHDPSGEHVEGTIFRTLDDAEREIPTVVRRIDDLVWQPKRYPGRSAQRDEVTVYLDRAHPERRREVSIIRCASSAPTVDLACHYWGRHLV